MDILDALINGPKPVNVPSPIAPLNNALTLGQLSNSVQTGGLNLQILRNQLAMQQDPDYPKYIGALMSMASGGQPNSDAADLAQGLFSKYPMQGANAINQMMSLSKNASEIRKSNADADAATTKARSDQLQVLSNAAGGLATSPGPLDAGKVLTFVRQGQYLGATPLLSDVISAVQGGDENGVRQALMNFSQAGSTLAQRAVAGKDTGETALQGPKYNLDRYNAVIKAVEASGAHIVTDASTGQMSIVRPNAGAMPPAPPAVGGAAPVRGADGQFPAGTPVQPQPSMGAMQQADAAGIPASYSPSQPSQAISAPPGGPAPGSDPGNALPAVQGIGVQGALAPGAQEQKTVLGQTLTESRKSANAAQESMLLLPALRSTLAQGYTGPIAASPVGKQLLNFAVTVGAISPDDVSRVGSMRMSDALVTKLLGPMAHSLSQRGMTQQSQKLIEQSKPGTENSLPVADAMINSLMTDARNSIKYDTALNQYVSKNPNDLGLTGWAASAPKPDLPPPPGQRADQLPPASVANIGMKAYDTDSGRVYINRSGSKWELVQ